MKRNILFVLILMMVLLPCFSASHIFGVQMSLGTGVTVYGDKDVVAQQSTNFPYGSTRFILNTEVDGVFFINDILSLNLGTSLSFDSFKCVYDTMFLLDYDFYFGPRIYPKIQWFCFGIDYVCGGYTNFLNVNGSKYNVNGDWSNGFRLAAEFNILSNKEGWTPAAGIYWKCMPRNGGYDHTFAIYGKACFR